MTKPLIALLIYLCLAVGAPVAAQSAPPQAVPTAEKNAEAPATPAPAKGTPTPFDADIENEGAGQSRFFSEFIHMLLSLGFIIFIMVLVAWAMKRVLSQRVQQANLGSSIKILERRSLSPKSAVYVIEIAGRTLIVGESTTGLHALAEVPPETRRQGASFSDIYDEKKT